MEKLRNFLILMGLACLIAIIILIWRKNSFAPTFSVPIITPSPSPSSRPVTVDSPDGKFALIAEEKTVAVFDRTKNIKKIIGDSYFVPFNAFSPDNKYIFLKELESGDFVALPLSDIQKTANISSLFTQKYPDFKITDVTGWGGVGLIVINTDKAEGGIGPSFWYEAFSGNFIRLSTRFN